MDNITNTFWHKTAISLTTISLNICFACSNEPSRRDDSFECLQYMFY